MEETYHGPSAPSLRHRLRSATRIGLDHLHSCLRPVVVPPGASPSLQCLAAPTPEPPGAEAPSGEWLRLLIWNIHRGYGGGQLASVLRRLLTGWRPDVLLLQEVPVFPAAAPDSPRRPFWQLPAIGPLLRGWHLAFTPMHRVTSPTEAYPFEESGLLTAARFPLRSPEAFALPTVTRPKLGRGHSVGRVALRVEVAGLPERAGEPLAIYNVHLENTAPRRGRALQAAAIVEHAATGAMPTLLGGDWNTMFGSWEGVFAELRGAGFEAGLPPWSRRGFPHLDHLFHRGVGRTRVRQLALPGSDHRPLAAWVQPSAADKGDER